MKTHVATLAARIIARNLDAMVSTGALSRDEADVLSKALPQLEWLGRHADVLRDIAQRIAAATRETRLLTDDEIADLSADISVAAVLAAFPGAVVADKPLPPITPPDAAITDPMGSDTNPHHGGKVSA